MKDNWEIKTLQEVCIMKITDGTHQTPKYCEKVDGGYPFISSKNVTKEYIDWSDIKYIIPELHEALYKRIAPQKNDVLLAKNGTTGVAAIVDDDRIFDIYVTLAVLRPNTKIIYPQYLLKIINSPICKVQFNAHLKGSGVPNLHLEEIQKVTIPLPPLSEQKRIVKILDEKFAQLETVKANAKANLQNAKDLFQSQLTKAFTNTTWEKKRLGEVCDVRDGTHDSPKFISEGYPLVTSKNLRNGIVEKTNVKFISKEDYDKINQRSKVDINDVLFAMIGTIGNPVVVKEEPDYAIKNMALIKPLGYTDSYYLQYFLYSDVCLSKMESDANGSTQRFVSLGYLRNFEIPLPPLPEQKRIVEQLDSLSQKVRSLKEIYTKQLANCDELKQAFLAKAFAGEL